MNENPYSRQAEWFAEYRRKVDAEARAFRMRVPSLSAVVSAYLADAIDSFDLESLVEASVFGRAVEEPRCLASFDPDRAGVRHLRMTDAPGQVIRTAAFYRRPKVQRLSRGS